ncbi:MAG: hypothetical protein WD065_18005 [Planctomycetaceae bacterium]
MAQQIETEDGENPFFDEPFTAADRIWLFVVAAVLGTIASWMFWIVHTFLDGRGWGEFAIRMILDDIIFSVAMLASLFALYALFKPRWINRILTRAAGKLYFMIMTILTFFAVTSGVFILVFTVLQYLGMVK